MLSHVNKGVPMTTRFVTIVLPALNEEAYIEAAISTILPVDAEFDYEVLVMDGGSSDRTVELVEAMSRDNPRIRVLHNAKRLQSAGVNEAARQAHPDSTVIVRGDCHAVYPPNFVRRCISVLDSNAVQSVVVPMNTVGTTAFQRAAAAAQNSVLGNGGSAHRRGTFSGLVEHGHHAAFDRAFFLSMGGYDETFATNEDAELDIRIVRAGGRIWLDSENPVTYFPRASLRALARQYFKHGAGRARTIRKHAVRPKARQLAPVFILSSFAGGAVLASTSAVFLAPAAAYTLICCTVGAAKAVRTRQAPLVMMGPAAMAMHLGWAAGFLRTVTTWRQSKPLSDVAITEAR